MSDTSGQLFAMPLLRYDPATCSLRTSSGTPPSDLDQFFGTWLRSGSMLNGEFWEAPPLEPATDDTGSGSSPRTATKTPPSLGGTIGPGAADPARPIDLNDAIGPTLPTPTARDWKGPTGLARDGGDDLPTVVRDLLPTPTASDGKRSRTNERGTCLQEELDLLPTPQAKDGTAGPDYAKALGGGRIPSGDSLVTTVSRIAGELTDGEQFDFGRYQRAVDRWARLFRPPPLPVDAKHRLAPAFVEWMMGYPAGWVTDPAHGMTRSQQLFALGNAVQPQTSLAAYTLLDHRRTMRRARAA